MEFQELKKYLTRLYKEYVKKHLGKILISLVLSLFVAGSTSATAWLLDPAVKKIFIEQDRTLAWLIPILIILAFSTKGISLYFARMTIIRVAQEVAGEIQKKIANNILVTDILIKDFELRYKEKIPILSKFVIAESNMKILFETKSHLEYLNFIEK